MLTYRIKKWHIYLFLLILVSAFFYCNNMAYSFYSNENFGDDFRYENLKIDNNLLTGTIINTSNRKRTRVSMRITAANVDGSVAYWQTSINIGTMEPHGLYHLRAEYYSRENPAQFIFTVTEDKESNVNLRKEKSTVNSYCTINQDSSEVNIRGQGQCSSDRFKLSGGFVKVKARHDGKGNFIVHLIDHMGQVEKHLVNEIGPYQGSSAFNLRAGGHYVINTKADGDWSVTLENSNPKQEYPSHESKFQKKINIVKEKDGSLTITDKK